MRRTLDIETDSPGDVRELKQVADSLARQLEADGITVLPELFCTEHVNVMQEEFGSRLKRLRWNNFEGYQKTEPYRHMVEDVLLLGQGFVDLALHPLVKAVLNRYLGMRYALTEAKGWLSLPTKRDFHGWHGDAWYDQSIGEIPREVKLAMYLTDVDSGAFNYLKGTHRKQHPRPVKNHEIENLSSMVEVKGKAGTAFLFDTSGIHRQGVPMLEPRRAIFYNYHDPRVPLQKEDLDYYRYHPLLLNAAFLGNLSLDDHRILGFGDKTNFIPGYERATKPSLLYNLASTGHNLDVRIRNFAERISARMRRMFA
jgi:hypothetical protein